jgi:hypothetical protein
MHNDSVKRYLMMTVDYHLKSCASQSNHRRTHVQIDRRPLDYKLVQRCNTLTDETLAATGPGSVRRRCRGKDHPAERRPRTATVPPKCRTTCPLPKRRGRQQCQPHKRHCVQHCSPRSIDQAPWTQPIPCQPSTLKEMDFWRAEEEATHAVC